MQSLGFLVRGKESLKECERVMREREREITALTHAVVCCACLLVGWFDCLSFVVVRWFLSPKGNKCCLQRMFERKLRRKMKSGSRRVPCKKKALKSYNNNSTNRSIFSFACKHKKVRSICARNAFLIKFAFDCCKIESLR